MTTSTVQDNGSAVAAELGLRARQGEKRDRLAVAEQVRANKQRRQGGRCEQVEKGDRERRKGWRGWHRQRGEGRRGRHEQRGGGSCGGTAGEGEETSGESEGAEGAVVAIRANGRRQTVGVVWA